MPTILYGNMKGGVGKTTNSVMTAYQLAKLGYKTLVCDLDPQANATQLLRRTYGLQYRSDLQIDKTMMVALMDENIKPAIVNIMDNLYLLPSSEDFKNYPDFLEMKFMLDKEKIQAGDSNTLQSEMSKVKEQRIAYFAQQLAKVRDEYDFIIIDVPPTLSIFTDSAIYATDFVIIVLQTQQRSLDGAETFFEYLQQMYNDYINVDFDILGVLAVLLKNNAGLTTWYVAPMFYFMGVIAIIISGIMLKKTKLFAGETTPFIMELPQYHMPGVKNILLSMWERVKGYIIKAGTIIFLSTIVIWFLMNFGDAGEGFGLLDSEAPDYMEYSLMAGLGNLLAWIFAPLGFANWQATATAVTGLVAKENVVATVGIITQLGDFGEADPQLWYGFAQMLGGSTAAIVAFCAFNLLCAPCFAAMGTIRQQQRSAKWFWITIGYMCGFAWCVGCMLYQFVGLALGEVSFSI